MPQAPSNKTNALPVSIQSLAHITLHGDKESSVLNEKNEVVAPEDSELQHNQCMDLDEPVLDKDEEKPVKKYEENHDKENNNHVINQPKADMPVRLPRSMLEPRSMPDLNHAQSLEPGALVLFRDIVSKPELNGTRGIVRCFNSDKQRYEIDVLLSGRTICLKPANVIHVPSKEHPARSNFIYRLEIRRSGHVMPEHVSLLEIGSDSSAHGSDSSAISNVDIADFSNFDSLGSIPQIEARLLIQRKSDGFVLPFPSDHGDAIPAGLSGEFKIYSNCIVTASGTRQPADRLPNDLPEDAQRLPLSEATCSFNWSVMPTDDTSEVRIPLTPLPIVTTGINTSLQIRDIHISMLCRFNGTNLAWKNDPMNEVPHTEEMSDSLWSALSVEAAGLFAPADHGICGCPGSGHIVGAPSHQRPWIEPEAVGRGVLCVDGKLVCVDGSCWHGPGHRRCGWSNPRCALNGMFMVLPRKVEGVQQPFLTF